MNFLALCQKTAQLIGIGHGTPPTVVNQTQQNLQIVDWVKQSWVEIQDKHFNFDFLWYEFDFQTEETTLGSSVWKQTIDVRGVLVDPKVKAVAASDFIIYETGASRDTAQRLRFHKDYPSFRRQYLFNLNTQRPTCVTQRPDKKLEFNTIPDKFYTVEFSGWRDAQQLTLDVDTPLCHEDYHMAIVYLAAMKAHGFFEAPMPYEAWNKEFGKLFADLKKHHLPKRTIVMRPIA